MTRGLSRRQFLGGAAAVTTASLVAAEGTAAAATRSAASPRSVVVPFEGAHQAGIITPAQSRLLFASFDVLTDDREQLVELLQSWTRAARTMAAGRPVGTDNTDQDVADHAKAASLHDLAGEPAGQCSDDQKQNEIHLSSRVLPSIF